MFVALPHLILQQPYEVPLFPTNKEIEETVS